MAPPRLQVLYDPDCGICTRTARFLRAMDRRRERLEVIGFDVARQRHLVDELDDARLYASFHAIAPDGPVVSGAPAIPLVLERLVLGRAPAGWIRRSPFLQRVVAGAYAWVVRHRGVTGCPPGLEGRVPQVSPAVPPRQ